MLSNEQRVAIADELFAADQARSVIPLLTKRFPEMEVADSYAVQGIWAQRRLDAGYKVVGHKIGLTSKVMQQATGADMMLVASRRPPKPTSMMDTSTSSRLNAAKPRRVRKRK